ncbi:MAG: DsbA family protein [Acidimicrobiales bacterium]
MSGPTFALTYDYRCPFARNAHEHVLAGLADGADWDVLYVPFSLSQAHIEPGGLSVWDDPAKAADLMALEVSVVVRERDGAHFPAFHRAMFAARHDEGHDLRERAVIDDVMSSAGVDLELVQHELDQGWPREEVRRSHEAMVEKHQVFGVPTFVDDHGAVFVRIMTRPGAEPGSAARAIIDHVLSMMTEHPELNEFKHTSVAR